MMSKYRMLLIVLVAATAMCGWRAFAEEEDEGKEVKIKFSEAPAAVQATIKEEAGGVSIENLDKETHKDGKIVYEADAMIGGTNYEIDVAEDGKLISKAIDTEDEQKQVKFDDAPAAVQATLKEESHGAAIEKVEKEMKEDGKSVFEAKAAINGSNYEIKVSESGKLISKKLKKEEHEKKESGEKEKD